MKYITLDGAEVKHGDAIYCHRAAPGGLMQIQEWVATDAWLKCFSHPTVEGQCEVECFIDREKAFQYGLDYYEAKVRRYKEANA